jgi:GMP synthase PP-ATPase subunit
MNPAINEAIKRIQEIQKQAKDSNFVWDNKIVYGTGTFNDEIKKLDASVEYLAQGTLYSDVIESSGIRINPKTGKRSLERCARYICETTINPI